MFIKFKTYKTLILRLLHLFETKLYVHVLRMFWQWLMMAATFSSRSQVWELGQ